MTMHPSSPGRERTLELLADRALQGLAGGERDELDALLRDYPDLGNDDLDLAVAALDEISGRTSPEDLLDRIFARFCIGK